MEILWEKERRKLLYDHGPSAITPDMRLRHQHVVCPEAHPLAVGAVGFKEGCAADSDELLYP